MSLGTISSDTWRKLILIGRIGHLMASNVSRKLMRLTESSPIILKKRGILISWKIWFPWVLLLEPSLKDRNTATNKHTKCKDSNQGQKPSIFWERKHRDTLKNKEDFNSHYCMLIEEQSIPQSLQAKAMSVIKETSLKGTSTILETVD